jgi:PAS domain-containing protein
MPRTSFTPTEPLALHHSWALLDRARRFEGGRVLDRFEAEPTGAQPLIGRDALIGREALIGRQGVAERQEWARRGVGVWECALPANTLHWSDEVYDIFGIPRTASPRRKDIVALYCEDSRAAMERLRAYAIKHQRGFTLDAQIRRAGGPVRWMRLIAAPIVEDGHVVRLHGLKQLL